VRWVSGLAIATAVAFAACTEQVAVGPEGQFSWEPQSQMIWPVQGAIVSAFGDAARPNHQGIDLAARPGEPIAAALLGKAEFVGEMPGYANVVVLAHQDGLSTAYAHLGGVRVREGDTVSRGQTIGVVAAGGYLHYEIRQAKQAVDPAKFYAVAPRPLIGGSVGVQKRLAEEPMGVGTPGTAETAEPLPAPSPLPSAKPMPAPTVAAPAPPPARVEPPSHPEPIPTPLETPLAPPSPLSSGTPVAENAGEIPTGSAESSGSFAMGAALVGANLFYMPAKFAYAGVGAVTGTVVLLLAHDVEVANDVWVPTLGGDYVVTERHLQGEAPLRFLGER